jgi:hypothetical protein
MAERIQALDNLGAEIARVAADAKAGPRIPKAILAIGVAVLLIGGTYSVPATRAAVGGITESFASWVSGESDEAPGHALGSGDDVRSWPRADGETRLIAKTEGVGLYVRRSDSPKGPRLTFGLGEGVPLAVSGSLNSWRESLGDRGVVVFGTAPVGRRDFIDERGRVPLLGLTTRDVKQVELRYSEGLPSVGDTGDGGFVLFADAWRPPRELIAYDASGRVVGRVDMRRDDFRYLCDKEPGVCPPDPSSSRR